LPEPPTDDTRDPVTKDWGSLMTTGTGEAEWPDDDELPFGPRWVAGAAVCEGGGGFEFLRRPLPDGCACRD